MVRRSRFPRRHLRRRRRRQPEADYVTPVRKRQAKDQWGSPIPNSWQTSELPEAIFAPGVSDESQLLSEAAQHRAQLLFEQYVDIESTDHVEVPQRGTWQLDGHPNHWPLGTVVTLRRAS